MQHSADMCWVLPRWLKVADWAIFVLSLFAFAFVITAAVRGMLPTVRDTRRDEYAKFKEQRCAGLIPKGSVVIGSLLAWLSVSPLACALLGIFMLYSGWRLPQPTVHPCAWAT